ncbi:MAG TPA: lysylphosphatidylglycerol synthase transmembrane domain-containing protein [Negativicutes bacterium]|nr:lysylphosphatidylglycerol synthase transmembrane domain-containing protein [Negativicutes bacterium]
MNISRKRIAVLIGLIVFVSFIVLYFTVDMDTLRQLSDFHPASLVGVIVLIGFGMYFDALRLQRLSAVTGKQVELSAAIRVVFGNYFMALLTPGATGGAVIQVLFLKRAGIPTGSATVVVLIRTILSILFLVLCLPVVFYYDPQILPWFDRTEIVRSAILLAGLVLVGMAALRTRLSDRLAVVLLKRFPVRWRFRLMKVYRDMRGALALMAASPIAVGWAFLESGISLLLIYAMVPMLFLGIGAQIDWVQVMGRMVFLNLLLYFAPTPGGAGVAEALFVSSFKTFLPLGTVGVAAVAWRIFAEYLPACIGGYFTLKIFGTQGFRSK